MEEAISKTVSEYMKEKEKSIKIDKDYKKGNFKTNNIILDAEILKEILLKTKIEKIIDYDYYSYITPSCRLYLSPENFNKINDIDLNFSYIINFYYKDISSFYKYISIFHELVCVHKKLNVKEPSFSKFNSDEIKIFSKFLLHCINKTDEFNFDKFIYIKHYDLEKLMDIKQKKQFSDTESNILKLIYNFDEILKIFDEIYDTKLFNELSDEIIKYDKIENNKLFLK